ncbi:hypothetical protein WJX82_008660 [Trebouxia sp. C0006]
MARNFKYVNSAKLVGHGVLRRVENWVGQEWAAVSSALALDIGSPSNFQAVTNIVSAVLLGAGAWWYFTTQNNTEGQEVCPKCRGSGVIECFCRKWSDNDVGATLHKATLMRRLGGHAWVCVRLKRSREFNQGHEPCRKGRGHQGKSQQP